MVDEKKYTIERVRGAVCIYTPDGSKMAEVFGGTKEREYARLIVNGLNMRHRWLRKQGIVE